MSRGAPRGRGRGRGGAAFNLPEHSTLNRQQWMEALREPTKNAGMLYPPLDPNTEVATLRAPDQRDEALVERTTEMYLNLSNGKLLYDGSRGPTPWRIHTERKVVGIEIEQYSERNRNATAGPSKSTSKLDPSALYLDQEYLPASLWKDTFDPEASTGAKRAAPPKPKPKKKKRLDSDEEEDAKPGEEELEASPAPSSEDEEFDFEDESDHQDYDANYFDNGEGDDDSGGEEEEDGGGFD